jgi:type IV pilus assembly protein PilE
MKKYRDKLAMYAAKGLTLVELMMTVAIIGIIASIAIPSFQNQIVDARRRDGITQLLQLQMQQESYRLTNKSYATTTQLGLPVSDYYAFTSSTVSATTYTLTATAKSSQTGDSACTALTLDQSMNKAPEACW